MEELFITFYVAIGNLVYFEPIIFMCC